MQRAIPVKAVLVLYIMDGLTECSSAWEATWRAHRRFPLGVVEFQTRNLSRPMREDRDRSILTVPTLLMIAPREEYLVHDITEERILAMLRSVGLEPKPEPR